MSNDDARHDEMTDSQLDQFLAATNRELLDHIKAAVDADRTLNAIMARTVQEAPSSETGTPASAALRGADHGTPEETGPGRIGEHTKESVALAQLELRALRQDPQVRRLARVWAGDPELAEDALQSADSRVAAMRHPEQVQNPRAYFLRVLRNEVRRLAAGQETLLDPSEPGLAVSGSPPSRPVGETVNTWLPAQAWLTRFNARRDELFAAVPARSDDPARYRTTIFAAAQQVLLAGIDGELSDADSPRAFRAAFPEYFDQPGAKNNMLYQRFRRAREDVKTLLRAIVGSDLDDA
jgi:DNA-directed RNA polymerase specialized sigma24 family protein